MNSILQELTNNGNTVIVIEHNLDVLKCSDWIIDLGLNGGEEGGHIISEGTPEEIAKKNIGYTSMLFKKSSKSLSLRMLKYFFLRN